jgi:hypothetical protein
MDTDIGADCFRQGALASTRPCKQIIKQIRDGR